jgi:hypothetical protein
VRPAVGVGAARDRERVMMRGSIVSVTADDLVRRAAAAANQLRMVQISFADEPADKRQGYMCDAVEQAAAKVLPEQRAEFLKALAEHFPLLESSFPAQAETPAPAEPGTDESPEELVERFLELAQFMEEEEREALVARLQKEGLAPPSRPGAARLESSAEGLSLPEPAEKALQYLMRRLGVEKLNLTRVLKLMVLLVDQAGGSDTLVWNTWRVVAPDSSIRRPCDLRKEMARYVSGDRDISGVEMKKDFEILRKLMAALIAAVGQVGNQFARSHLARFSPEAIETHVEMEGGGLLSSREVKYWGRFVELSRELNSNHVEHAVKQSIANYTESLMKKSASASK